MLLNWRACIRTQIYSQAIQHWIQQHLLQPRSLFLQYISIPSFPASSREQFIPLLFTRRFYMVIKCPLCNLFGINKPSSFSLSTWATVSAPQPFSVFVFGITPLCSHTFKCWHLNLDTNTTSTVMSCICFMTCLCFSGYHSSSTLKHTKLIELFHLERSRVITP